MKKLISATALALISVTANAQLNWQKGGNSTFPFGAPSTLGTNYNAPLGFLTNGTQRMTILGGVAGGATTGFVGIGNFQTPKNMLHIHDGGNAARLQITNTNTGSSPTATDGFTIGIEPNGNALLNQQEDKPMWFKTGSSTGSQPRMAITGGTTGNGFVGIGDYTTFTPEYHLDI